MPGAARGPAPARRVLTRLLVRAWDDDVLGQSASAAFWQTLSLPPLLLGLFGLLGYAERWFGPDTVVAVQEWITRTSGGVFSRNAVEEIIAPTVAEILTSARGEVVSIGFLLSFWSGSSAMATFVDAITRAHDQFPVRGWLWQRSLAILLYLAGLAVGIVALPLAALGPERLLPLLPDPVEPAAWTVVNAVYLPALVVVLVLALATLYKIALPLKPPWHRGLPGAVLAAVVFLVGATGLRLYLDWITSTGYTYGALAAPIAFLLGMYFIALAVIIGAYLNAAIQAVRPAPLRRRGRLVTAGPGASSPVGTRPTGGDDGDRTARVHEPPHRRHDDVPPGRHPGQHAGEHRGER
ncbi:MAG TPA: YihY/virulence factor BrkB family protein [Pseudonocardia sp.]|uniref:YihY/virulence factor BrkB family protein n=1 Tax=Pseudonocardia sp. TaxID=60912 RepID=UPI002B4AF956|nr:YihY/virulence factor BrkB family protein [Pseudonocardia sp.]HLU56011.1 YihY/virulence factor BrkB family protein [Pseudonocardia sp.]